MNIYAGVRVLAVLTTGSNLFFTGVVIVVLSLFFCCWAFGCCHSAIILSWFIYLKFFYCYLFDCLLFICLLTNSVSVNVIAYQQELLQVFNEDWEEFMPGISCYFIANSNSFTVFYVAYYVDFLVQCLYLKNQIQAPRFTSTLLFISDHACILFPFTHNLLPGRDITLNGFDHTPVQ